MADPTQSDGSFTSVRAMKEAAVLELRDLRYIGQTTAEILADASISAAHIRDQAVSYLRLVDEGVDPGVAARIRREHSLPWSDEPSEGPRLRRRAQHVRHLRDDERSWIDESWAAARSTESPPGGATSDGSGDPADAERAWRERSRADSTSKSRSGAHSNVRPSRSSPNMDPPVNPSDHTVAELKDVLESVDDPPALAALLRAERASDDRTTAVEAIERRLRAVSVDPDGVVARNVGTEPDASTDEKARFHEWADAVAARWRGMDSVPTSLDAVEGYDERLSTFRDAVRRAVVASGRTGRRYEARLRAIGTDDWRQISMALLMGLIGLSGMAVLVTAMGPAEGRQLSVLSLFLVTLVVGVVTLPLRWWDAVGGYGLSLFTALVGLGSVGLIAVGTAGNVTIATTSVSLSVYALVAASLLTSTYLSGGEIDDFIGFVDRNRTRVEG